jgi:uncharacterized membrane protein required for colicin V production
MLLNVLLLAAMHGFFAEVLSMAGLFVGYIVAAWQYQRLAAVVAVVSEVGIDRSDFRLPHHLLS